MAGTWLFRKQRGAFEELKSLPVKYSALGPGVSPVPDSAPVSQCYKHHLRCFINQNVLNALGMSAHRFWVRLKIFTGV